MTVPFQRIVQIHKSNIQKEPFLSISRKTLAAAYNDLNNAYSFFMYIYFCCNADNFSLEFSPLAIENEFGFSKSTARDHFKKLVEKGYLVQQNPESNIFHFYAEPKHLKDAIEDTKNEPKEFKF